MKNIIIGLLIAISVGSYAAYRQNKMIWAETTCSPSSCTINQQSSEFSSFSYNGSGQYTANWTNNLFGSSNNAMCFCTVRSNSGGTSGKRYCNLQESRSTSSQAFVVTDADGSAGDPSAGASIYFMCVGGAGKS